MLAALASQPVLLASASEDEMTLKVIALIGGMTIAVVWMLLKTVRVVSVERAAENTKREIAAYVAEGTISPQDAAVLLNAGADSEIVKITSAVAAGVISPAKAEKLIASLRDSWRAPAN